MYLQQGIWINIKNINSSLMFIETRTSCNFNWIMVIFKPLQFHKTNRLKNNSRSSSHEPDVKRKYWIHLIFPLARRLSKWYWLLHDDNTLSARRCLCNTHHNRDWLHNEVNILCFERATRQATEFVFLT